MKKSLLFIRLIFIGLIMLFGSGWVKGQALLVENFDYPIGALLTTNGWTAHSGAGTQAIDVTTGLSFTGYIGSAIGGAANLDNTGEDVTKAITTQTSGTIYYSALVKVNAAVEGYFLHLSASTNTFAARIFVKPSSTSGKINFGFSNISVITTATYAATPTDFDPETTYLIIVKYDVSTAGYGSMWVISSGVPATEAIAGTPEHTNSGSGIASVIGVSLRQYNASQRIVIDGIRVGTTWDIVTSNIWNGNSSNDWATAGNWSDGIPTIVHDVIIPGGLTNYPVLTSAGSCNDFVIAAGGALTVTDAGTLTNGGTATILSDATQSGSLILEPGFGYSGSGIVSYKRYMTGTDWHLTGSPTIDQMIDATFLSENAIIGMKDYVESADNWSDDYFSTSPPNVECTFGKGYATKLSADGLVTFTGNISTGPETVALTRAAYGWNLLSNPYTSAINAAPAAHATDNLITVNTAVLDPSYAALYIWDQASISYLIINNAGDGTLVQNYLQVGQGFFVKSKTGGGNFTMTQAMQSSQTATAFKSSSASSWAGFTLTAETGDVKASTQIYYQENMSTGLDIGYDAGSFKSNPNFSLYSRLVEDNGVDFGLQCLPADYENLVIPIGLTAKAGDMVKFSASALNIPEEYAVVLEDRTTNTFTNLSDVPDYSIQLSSDIDGTGRFFVRTSFKSTLGIENPNLVNPYQVFTRPIENQLLIRGESFANTTAHIYSITGKLVAGVGLKQTTENTVSFNENSGIYIVKISNEQGSYTQKFSWVK